MKAAMPATFLKLLHESYLTQQIIESAGEPRSATEDGIVPPQLHASAEDGTTPQSAAAKSVLPTG